IVPFVTTAAGFTEQSVAPLLLAYGLAGAVGLFLVGVVGSRFPRASLIGAFVVVAAAVLLIAGFPQVGWLVIVALVIWGVAFGGTPALLQTRLLHTASSRLRDVSAAYFTSAFNVGIGGGALVGGILLDHFSLGVLPFVDVAVTVVGIGIILIGDGMLRRRAGRFALPS
ncbi:MAG: transporter, partial [Microbacteriaceae bacterium]|nr:transporter [Microbacteriaceae bacterium]